MLPLFWQHFCAMIPSCSSEFNFRLPRQSKRSVALTIQEVHLYHAAFNFYTFLVNQAGFIYNPSKPLFYLPSNPQHSAGMACFFVDPPPQGALMNLFLPVTCLFDRNFGRKSTASLLLWNVLPVPELQREWSELVLIRESMLIRRTQNVAQQLRSFLLNDRIFKTAGHLWNAG